MGGGGGDRRGTNVADVVPSLYKYYTNICFCLLGNWMGVLDVLFVRSNSVQIIIPWLYFNCV